MPEHRVKDLATVAVVARYFDLRAEQAPDDRAEVWAGVAARLYRIASELAEEARETAP